MWNWILDVVSFHVEKYLNKKSLYVGRERIFVIHSVAGSFDTLLVCSLTGISRYFRWITNMPPLTSSSVIERAKLGHPEDSRPSKGSSTGWKIYVTVFHRVAAYNGVIKYVVHTHARAQKVFRWKKIKGNKRKLVRKDDINNFSIRRILKLFVYANWILIFDLLTSRDCF